jgi:hypothetical protein
MRNEMDSGSGESNIYIVWYPRKMEFPEIPSVEMD